MPPRKEFSSISHDSFGKDGNACVVNVGVFVPCGNPFQYICTRNDVEVITHPFATARPKGERGGVERERQRERETLGLCVLQVKFLAFICTLRVNFGRCGSNMSRARVTARHMFRGEKN